jgi:outer membrane murein-binding lipoprotein Lpp
MDDSKLDTLEAKVDAIAKAESPLNKYLLQLITLVFLAGGGWMTLSNVQALADENKAKIEQAATSTATIEKKLVRIETTQEQMKQQLDEAAKTAKENARKLDQILNKLDND